MPIVKPIHAHVGEVVEIHWHRTIRPVEGEQRDPRSDVWRQRVEAPDDFAAGVETGDRGKG
jgi:hypothetical protein